MKSKTKEFTWILQLMRPYRGRIMLMCLLSVAASVLLVAFAMVSRNVVDCAIAGGEGLPNWGIALLCPLAAVVALQALQRWLVGSASDRCVAAMRRRLLSSAAYSSDEKLHGYRSGELLSRGMEDVYTVCEGGLLLLPGAAGHAARLAAGFAAILAVYWPLAVLVAAAGVAIVLLLAAARPVLKKHHARVRKADAAVMADMQEDLQQLELIQSLSAQKQVLTRFDYRLQNSLHAKGRRRIWTVGYSTVLSAASQFGTGIALLWGASLIAAQSLSYGTLTAVLQLLNLIRTPVVGLSGMLSQVAAVEVAAGRLQTLLEDTPEQSAADVTRGTAVVFENVTFSYPGDTQPVLENFSCRFPLDGWTCLTGVSGRGKSTVFKLMLGLYQPQQGRVYVETAEAFVPCSPATRHLFAYVPQDYTLLSGTVLDNLLLVAPDATREQRAQALRTARAEFVWDLSAGENTPVRENNAGLSKGQLQRLAIARALLMERPVLLLDECTSALDADTEQTVLKNLHAAGKNTILVTHRPEALRSLTGIQSITLQETEK